MRVPEYAWGLLLRLPPHDLLHCLQSLGQNVPASDEHAVYVKAESWRTQGAATPAIHRWGLRPWREQAIRAESSGCASYELLLLLLQTGPGP